jgi:hypothetical protein
MHTRFPDQPKISLKNEKRNGKKLLKPPFLPIQAETLENVEKTGYTDAIPASRQKSITDANDIASRLLRVSKNPKGSRTCPYNKD